MVRRRTRHNGLAMAGLALVAAVSTGCRRDSGDDSVASDQPPAPDPCEDGVSVDPTRAELEPAKTAFEEREYAEAIEKYDVMAEKYPHSATVRVWRAEATLYQSKLSDGRKQYEQAATEALPFYGAAEKLHDRGCRLPDEAQYYMRMGSAYAHLRKGDAKQAAVQLEKARNEFPDSAEVTYALARAKCLLDDVAACARYFEQTLKIARELRRPLFLRTHRSMDEWIRRSRTQTELGPLREDPRYDTIVREARASDD